MFTLVGQARAHSEIHLCILRQSGYRGSRCAASALCRLLRVDWQIFQLNASLHFANSDHFESKVNGVCGVCGKHLLGDNVQHGSMYIAQWGRLLGELDRQ